MKLYKLMASTDKQQLTVFLTMLSSRTGFIELRMRVTMHFLNLQGRQTLVKENGIGEITTKISVLTKRGERHLIRDSTVF